MTNDGEKRQLELELLAADLRLRRKQEFWETPRNIAILIGVTATIAAAIGYWLGRASTAPSAPTTRPVFLDSLNGLMTGGQFIDAVQTASLVVMTAMIAYVIVRLDRTLTAAAREIKGALTAQSGLAQTLERTRKRLEALEQILPTAKLGETLKELRDRLDRLEKNNGQDEIR